MCACDCPCDLVHFCLCACVHVCACACACVRAHACTCVGACERSCTCFCVLLYVYLCAILCTLACLCMCVGLSICLCVRLCMHCAFAYSCSRLCMHLRSWAWACVCFMRVCTDVSMRAFQRGYICVSLMNKHPSFSRCLAGATRTPLRPPDSPRSRPRPLVSSNGNPTSHAELGPPYLTGVSSGASLRKPAEPFQHRGRQGGREHHG